MAVLKDYFRWERYILKLCGISLDGNETILYKMYSFVLIFLFECPYPFVSVGDLFKYGFNGTIDVAIYTIGTFLGVIIAVTTLKNRIRLGKLLDTIEKPPFSHNTERGGITTEEDLIKTCITYTTRQRNIFYTALVLELVPTISYTLSKRLRSNDYRDWEFAYGSFTILNVTYSPNFEISWFYQNVVAVNVGFTITAVTLITTGVLAHISIQFKILQNFLRRIIEYSYSNMVKDLNFTDNLKLENVKNSVIPWKYLRLSLKEVVLYHTSISNITKEAIDLFSMILFSSYVMIFGILCLMLYDASVLTVQDTTTALKIIMSIICILVEILLISYWGEQVATESEKLKDAVYDIDFVGTDLRFQRALALIMRRSQNTVKIKAGKLIDSSLVTFAWIVKTSYSSLMVMRKYNN